MLTLMGTASSQG